MRRRHDACHAGGLMDDVQRLAETLLYEGYILWPYRRSTTKNQQRWTIGGVYPRAYSDAGGGTDRWWVKAECLVRGAKPRVTVTIWDRDDPYHYAEVRGEVVETVTGPEARAHIDSLSVKYYGHEYRNRIQSERLILRIRPLRQRETRA